MILPKHDIAEVDVITWGFYADDEENLYLEIEGLDETYFMYSEDLDLCYTLIRKGYRKLVFWEISGVTTLKEKAL